MRAWVTIAALLVTSSAWAQPAVPVNIEGQPVRVNCVEGCSAGGGSSTGLTDTQLRATPLLVSGTFWPATQPVSGTLSIGNFPASQPVTGPLTDAQLRAQALAVTVGNWPSSQTVAGTVSVGNFPATQTIAGAVSVSNFPATQATRDAKDTARTLVGLSYTASAPTTADTVVTALVKASAGSAAAGAQSITAASLKTLRLTAAAVSIRTTTAALPWSLVTLRVSATTTCTAASSVAAYLPAGGTAAVIGNVGQFATQFPDGLELPAGGSLCISVSGNVTTNVITFSAQGFEY